MRWAGALVRLSRFVLVRANEILVDSCVSRLEFAIPYLFGGSAKKLSLDNVL